MTEQLDQQSQTQDPTDQAQAPQTPPQVPPQQPPLNPQQIAMIKGSLIEQLGKAYQLFLGTVLKIPSEPQGMRNAVQYFDTGFFWFKASIENLHLDNKQVILSPQAPVQPPQPDQSQPAPTPTDAAPAGQETEAPAV